MLRLLVVIGFSILWLLSSPKQAEAACAGGPTAWTSTPDRTSLASCVSQADDGDTISVSAGTGTGYTTGISINNKCISVIGAGVGATIIVDDIAATNQAIFTLVTKACSTGQIMRFSGFEIIDGAAPTSTTTNAGQINIYGTTASLRFDNNKITSSKRHMMVIEEYVRGVLDHNTFDAPGDKWVVTARHNKWLGDNAGCLTGMGITSGCGDRSWASSLTQGSSDQLYWEDNLFTNSGGGQWPAHDCTGGLREVVRFNRIYDFTWAAHDSARGGRQSRECLNLEAYRNYIRNFRTSVVTCCGAFGLGGGTAMIWQNDLERQNGASGAGSVIDWSYYHHSDVAYRQHYVFGTARPRTISSITCTGTTATVTVASAGGVQTGHFMGAINQGQNQISGTYQQIISGSSVAAYNGQKVVTSVPTTTTWTFTTTCGGTANNAGIMMKSVWSTYNGDDLVRGLSQIGSGPTPLANLVSGEVSQGAGTNTMLYAPAPGALMPVYMWGNRRDSNNATGTITYVQSNGGASGGQSANLEPDVTNNVHYFNQNNATCVAGGACTGGTGVGTTLPTTCTPGPGEPYGAAGEGGVFFWKTNEGSWNNETAADHNNAVAPHGQDHTLGEDGQGYRCTATNTWTLVYVPANYPHYLITGGPAPPQNVLPSVAITAPTASGVYDTSTSPIVTLAGTSVDSDGTVSSVTWACATCTPTSGTATGTTAWSVASITLTANSINTITFMATDNSGGQSATVSIQVNHVAAASTDTDTFNRSDWSTLGPNWTHIGSGSRYTITSNRAVGVSASFDVEKYGLSPSSADQCSQVTYISGAVYAFVRINGTVNGDLDGYTLRTSGATNTSIQEFDNGALSVLQSISTTFTSGDILKVCVEGAIIRGYKCTPSCSQIGTDQSDSTIADGEVGFALYQGAIADSFVGGDLSEVSDTEDPDVSITSPTTGGTYETTASMLTVSGTASDNVSVASNAWSTDQGGSGACTGTTSPSCADIPLVANVITTITVTATDGGANTGSDTLQVMSIPIPGTPLDSFTRVNWPGPGPNWTVIHGPNPVVNNGFLTTTSDESSYLKWNAHTLPADQCATIKVGAFGSTGSIGVLLRMSADTGADRDLYRVSVDSSNLQIIKEVDGEPTVLVTDINVAFAPSDLLTACVSGTSTTTILAYRTPVGQAQELIAGPYDDEDTPLADAGFGVYQFGAGALADDFSAEAYTPMGDVKPPVVAITSPTTSPTLATGLASISVAGTCAEEMGGSGIDNVTWSTNQGQSGTATGTDNWSISNISVPAGTPTVLNVICHDMDGNDSTPALLTITPLSARGGRHPLRTR